MGKTRIAKKSTNNDTRRMVFTPRGIDTKPANLKELFGAIGDVLAALVMLHDASWMHRDIRWANVMRRRNGSNSWFLIDYMNVEQSPAVSSMEASVS
ncbi:hypothetical protein L914_02588 [Phytophthora nicotianae]|uniref:Fungal-type protein kinase domain-containing protein n=2 Tax=Phytophthora nicotianae TaxID=4792 RepID=V9FUM8_PHYNI|nr:hypothetical protein F443_02715 [Phytophthora nicotianae P1569]ETM53982.1 hypothetical protein L914_02588 [Phytophthora nicotianae]